MTERGQKRVDDSDGDAPAAKKPAPEPPVASSEVQNVEAPRPESPQSLLSPKDVIMKHTFKNVSSMEDGDYLSGPIEDHFGLHLCLSVKRCDGYLGLYFNEVNAPGQWHLNIEGCLEALGKDVIGAAANKTIEDPPLHSFGWNDVSKWEEISDFLVDDSLTGELVIRINEMRKVGKKVLRNFDAAMEEVSDVVLIARNQKFYVSKYTLSSHSQYFKSLLLGPYKEANMPEITLNGVDPFDIQNYLEFLYLLPSITDDTVEGLLLLADQYDTGILKEKCERFLIKKSEKSLKKKFKMFVVYNCTMEKIIDEMITPQDVKEVIEGEDVDGMDKKLLAQLLVKLASLV